MTEETTLSDEKLVMSFDYSRHYSGYMNRQLPLQQSERLGEKGVLNVRDAIEPHMSSSPRRESIRHAPSAKFRDLIATEPGFHLRDYPINGNASMNIYFTRRREDC
jgi:hypothetical protein